MDFGPALLAFWRIRMKRTVKLSLGMSFIMLALVLIAPHLASPNLVLRFLPKDVYEAGKDHPAPSLPKQLLCHLLQAMAAVYIVWAYKDVADDVKKERLSFGEAYKRLLTFLPHAFRGRRRRKHRLCGRYENDHGREESTWRIRKYEEVYQRLLLRRRND